MKKRILTRPIGIMVTQEMFSTIDEVCEKREIGISDFVRSAIQDKLHRENDTESNLQGGNENDSSELGV